MSDTNLDYAAHREALAITISKGVCVAGAGAEFSPVTKILLKTLLFCDFLGGFVGGQYRGNASLGAYHAALLHPDALDHCDFDLLTTAIGSFKADGVGQRLWHADGSDDGSCVHPAKIECMCAGGWCSRSECRAKAVIYRRIVPRKRYTQHKKMHEEKKGRKKGGRVAPGCAL